MNIIVQVDKKVCPVCRREQSYDEYKEKRKFCSSCRKPYGKLCIESRYEPDIINNYFNYGCNDFICRQ